MWTSVVRFRYCQSRVKPSSLHSQSSPPEWNLLSFCTVRMRHWANSRFSKNDWKIDWRRKSKYSLATTMVDGAASLLSQEFQTFLEKNGIEWRSTMEYNSEQNGVSERGHLTLMHSARAMLVHARLPKDFWGPAILTACHVHNVCPHPLDPTTTPHEMLTRSKPDIVYLRT